MAFTFDELEPHERLALAGLVRLMVRMDGEFSPGEVIAVSELAKQLGSAEFWTMMNEAQLLEMEELSGRVATVQRLPVRVWMYGVLVELAAVDGIDPAETELLDWLSETWSLAAVGDGI
ncbi:MAG: hypothetical protein AAGH15_16625 [Myxococcota bacterium]